MLHEMVKDGESLFQRSSGNFLAHAHDHLASIRAAVDGSDAEQLIQTAHKLKGSALNLGLPRVGNAAADLEEQARAEQLEDRRGVLRPAGRGDGARARSPWRVPAPTAA